MGIKRNNLNIEEVLNYVGKNYVNVDKGRIRSANQFLTKVLNKVTAAMKVESLLFKAMFETYLYAGSSYDGLKIGKPDEYDIDLKLYLPAILDVQVLPSDKDGFVHIYLNNWDKLVKDKKLYAKYKELENFKDEENYLSQEKIKQWMESIVSRAVNKINGTKAFEKIDISYRVSGPAVTLIVNNMSIDLVAVFRMPGSKWPAYPVRQNFSSKKPDYVVVPKPPKIKDHECELNHVPERYWRLSFPEQELDYMFDYNFCKPALRFMKKLRDTRSHNIPSYFIKTIFLWEIEKRDKSFWRSSMTNVFLVMLKTYKNYIQNHNIPYFWSANNNFLQPNSEINITNLKDYLEGMIDDIERSKNSNPLVVAKYLFCASALTDLSYDNNKTHIQGEIVNQTYVVAHHLLFESLLAVDSLGINILRDVPEEEDIKM